MTARSPEMMMGRSIKIGLSTRASRISSLLLSAERFSVLYTASPFLTISFASILSAASVFTISALLGGVSRYLISTGVTPRSWRIASAVRDFEQRGLCQMVMVAMGFPIGLYCLCAVYVIGAGCAVATSYVAQELGRLKRLSDAYTALKTECEL